MKSYLPIIVKCSPIRKLALISYEKSPEAIYRGVELQYIDGEPYGAGYRVIAYRNDNYVDVYDDISLNFLEDEKFNVVENGLNKHIQTQINNVRFCKEGNNQIISFEFTDIQNRKISVYVEENCKRKSKAMNLLAPIGKGSKTPDFLPVFFMYDFDFIRKNKLTYICNVDGKDIKPDPFPIPMDGQARLYTRYSNECELLEFADTLTTQLQEVELDEYNTYRDGNVEYIFESKDVLKNVVVHFDDHNVQISFDAGLSLNKNCAGEFTISPREQMGYIKGEYRVCRDNNIINLKMIPRYGWVSKPNSFITKIILGKNSLFCSWSKKYEYLSTIDLATGKIDANWKNGNVK